MRQAEECSSEFGRSISERLCWSGADVVVVAHAAVAHQAGRGRLVAAVHGHQVDVDVDEEVGLGHPPVDFDVLALVGLTDHDEAGRVLGVVLQQGAVGREGVENPVAEAWRNSASVMRRCRPRAAIRTTSSTPASAAMSRTASMTRWRLSGRRIGGSGRERSSKAIVSRIPANSSSGSGRLSPSGLEQGPADGGVRVSERGQRFRGVHDPASFRRQAFQPEALPVPDKHGGSGTVDFENEPGTGHK